MAKWGEGDPRWIVEERPDATNVNNWHWTEKNACAWSVDKLKELLVNLLMESDIGKYKFTTLPYFIFRQSTTYSWSLDLLCAWPPSTERS
uniref:Activator of Hsp90 ATPase N-terminal domain-containing protein n=1 Tax=Timema bartmani TaxID=61472 RepID=A0A7R9EUH6_9NEOP|nr:unnamed protein product [Timema bartmani]